MTNPEIPLPTRRVRDRRARDPVPAPEGTTDEPRAVPQWVVFIEQLIISFGLYVFSIGPMYWFWFGAKYVNGPFLIAALYEPLWQLAGICPPFGAWLNWYVRLWIL